MVSTASSIPVVFQIVQLGIVSRRVISNIDMFVLPCIAGILLHFLSVLVSLQSSHHISEQVAIIRYRASSSSILEGRTWKLISIRQMLSKLSLFCAQFSVWLSRPLQTSCPKYLFKFVWSISRYRFLQNRLAQDLT